MTLRVIALYPTTLSALIGRPGVELRRRRERMWTQIDCELAPEDDRWFAHPVEQVGAGAPRPVYRARLEVSRTRMKAAGFAAVLQPADRAPSVDAEQRLLAPIINSPQRTVFEFQRAEVLFLSPAGDVELRMVAVDLASGETGTETLGRFHTRYLSLLQRCDAHVAGLIDLFPATGRRERYRRVRIPRGGADLGFGDGR
jgi:hypothetical protein